MTKEKEGFWLKPVLKKNVFGAIAIAFGLSGLIIGIVSWPSPGILYGSRTAYNIFMLVYFVGIIGTGIVVILRWKLGGIILFVLAGYVIVGLYGLQGALLYRVLTGLSALLFAVYLYHGLHRANQV